MNIFKFVCALILLPITSFAKCELDTFFQRSSEYIAYQINKENNEISSQDSKLSLLPDISVGVGQYINNGKGLVPFEKSNLFISISHDLLSTYRYFSIAEKIRIKNMLIDNGINQKRNEYILTLYSELLNLEFKKYEIDLINNRLNKSKIELAKTNNDYHLGMVSKITVDTKIQNIKKIELKKKELEINRDAMQTRISKRFFIPENMVNSINSDVILTCKKKTIQDLSKKDTFLKFKDSLADEHMIKTSRLPSVYISFNISPKNSGALENFSFKKADYSANIGLTVPLGSFISSYNNEKRSYIEMMKNQENHIKNTRDIDIQKDDLRERISTLKLVSDSIRHDITAQELKIKYIENTPKQSYGDLLAYIHAQDELYELQTALKKNEAETMYYTIYIDFFS
ncbi:TPA: hypothetical protein ACHF3Y_004638 [Escherichia coli]